MQPQEVFVVSDNIFSPLGTTTADNFSQLKNGISGVREYFLPEMSDRPFYASLIDPRFDPLSVPGQPDIKLPGGYTKFEQLLLASITDALHTTGVDAGDKKTILIISSTKGNISLLETEADDLAAGSNSPAVATGMELNQRIALHTSARLIADYFHFENTPLVVSNACISGILSILAGMRLIRSGQYENAVIAGADTISKFVLSGFESFQAISPGRCKPFDRSRDGINLGEGAATLILSSRQKYRQGIRVRGGSVGNDANHISGPSRTGEELCQVIERSLQDAGVRPGQIGFISAHGTATVFNDEMEAKAITLAGLQSVPVNSLKGYYGHMLGAAGLVETIVTLQSMREDLVLPSIGYEHNGVTKPLNICSSLLHTPLDHCLKTASGFGGCNAAVILSKQ
jgi:3-oxoacyl-[acyl-carrier-protein] synthase I